MKSDDDERMAHLAGAYEIRDLVERDPHHFGLLGGVEMRVISSLGVVRDERMTSVALDCGIRVDATKRFHPLAVEARLLDHFSAGGDERRRVLVIDHSAGNLQG